MNRAHISGGDVSVFEGNNRNKERRAELIGGHDGERYIVVSQDEIYIVGNPVARGAHDFEVMRVTSPVQSKIVYNSWKTAFRI